MTAEAWSAIAAIFSGLSAFVALIVSVHTERARRRHAINERELVLQEKLYAMFPKLVDTVGVDDELHPEVRKALVPFFMLYSHLWITYNEGITFDASWRGLKGDCEWWAARPISRQAWSVMRKYEDTWPSGFCAYVDRVLEASQGQPSEKTEKRHVGQSESDAAGR
ncbi:MAG: hypothetical protein ACRDTH_06105 [Pseudonocardiaceae bacterium]